MTEIEERVCQCLRDHPGGLISPAIRKLTGLENSIEWKGLLNNLEKKGVIRCSNVPFYGGWFNWYLV